MSSCAEDYQGKRLRTAVMVKMNAWRVLSSGLGAALLECIVVSLSLHPATDEKPLPLLPLLKALLQHPWSRELAMLSDSRLELNAHWHS